MDITTRLRINELVQKITESPGSVLDTQAAAELRGLVPASPKGLLQLVRENAAREKREKKSSGTATGLTHFFGNMQVGLEDAKTRAAEIKRQDSGELVRAGNYKILHSARDSLMMISHVWADSHPDQTGKRFVLRLDPQSAEPCAVLVSRSVVTKTFFSGTRHGLAWDILKKNPAYDTDVLEGGVQREKDPARAWHKWVGRIAHAGAFTAVVGFSMGLEQAISCPCKTDNVCSTRADRVMCDVERGAHADAVSKISDNIVQGGTAVLALALAADFMQAAYFTRRDRRLKKKQEAGENPPAPKP